VPAEFERFKPLLQQWDSAGKMFTECYAAGVTDDPRVSSTFRSLLELSTRAALEDLARRDLHVPRGLRGEGAPVALAPRPAARLPKDVKRYCFSYWQDSPLLNPPILRVLEELSGSGRRFFISSTEDLRFLEYGFNRRDLACWGALLELKNPDMPVAADLLTDGEFFGGPPGREGASAGLRERADAQGASSTTPPSRCCGSATSTRGGYSTTSSPGSAASTRS
jgi:hypothetical protein